MATDTTDSPISDALRNQVNDDRLIQKKLRKTRWQLKIAELAAACMLFAAGAIAFLLLLAVVDHWVLNLSFPLRLAALAAFLGSAGYFAWTMILPLLWRTISPVYAARMIEQGQPALKNGLINFLLLKQEAKPIHRAVLETVQQRAASDLKEYATETTVDFSKAIRVGYVFAAVALAFVVYKIASPKDPLTTVHRVISPWADIARPSRVDIVEVLPGDVQIYQGQTVEVAVKVYNFDEEEQVELFFSSADRRIVDQKVTLEPDESGLYFRGVIAPAGQGIQHNLAYFIKAGDATTRDYHITATAAPSIEVVDIRYDYPAYTMETPITQVRDGAVKALEGTRVTVKAVSNLPMEDAFIEFDPDAGDHANTARTKMTVSADDPTSAIGTFVIELVRHPSADNPEKIKATPKHRRYQLRFKTAAGDLNPYPVAYPIEVIRDLSPEVELLRPAGDKIRVPANGGAALEYRAIDPDYAVRQLTVIGEVDGKERLRTPLLQQSTTGNVIETYRFVPGEQKLKSGDQVTIYALAEDNRTDAAGRPTPNVTISRSLTIEITNPEQGAEKQIPPKQAGDQQQDGDKNQQGGDQQQGGDKNQQGGDQQQGGDKDQMGGDQQQGSDNDQMGGDQQQGGDKNQQGGDQQQGGDKNQQGGDQQQGGDKNQQGGDQQQGGDKNQQGGDQQQGGDKNQQGGDQQQGGGKNQQGGDQQQGGDKNQQGGDQQQGGGKNQQGGDQQQGGGKNQQGGDQQQGGGKNQQGGDQQQGGGKNQQGGGQQQGGDQNQMGGPQQGAGDQNQPGGSQQRGQQGAQDPNQNAPPKPLAADDSQAGDAFERIQKYLEKKEQEAAGGEKSGEQQGAMPGDKADGGASQPKDSGQPDRDHEATGNQTPEKGGEPKPSESGVDSDADNSRQEGGMKSEGEKPEDQQAGRQRGEGEMKDRQGDESGGDSEKGAPTESEPKSDPMGEERTGDNGAGDAGKSGTGNPGADEDQGSPSSPEGAPNTPSDKMGKPDGGEEKSEQGPKSAVGDHKENKQNNSKGESDGDRSGGGDSGGGQSAKQEGHDSPGESSAADKGTSASKQRGDGEEGSKGGDQAKTDKKTGAPGEEQGEGSGRDDKGDGDKSGGGKPGEPNEQTGQKPESGGESNQYGDGNPTGGGGMPSDQNATPDAGGPEHGGDEANLDYARKATDLVLDKLEHDQKEPDQELLNQLGWSKEQFREFTERWKAMKQAADAAAPGSEAKQELDEALRSLGLTPGKDQLRRNESNSAQQGGAADVNRSRPPAAFLEQYKAYLKGSAKQAPR
ncbi:hypothetical protein [Blastopirellula marina]|uniref:Circumsporozoite protein-putative membrane associated protein-like n=1 Tax=Blastopirellula marina DSM 3645 TaxID=314230 RepID=A3ZU70_9BACT|nr:hypothetical protein [Blastopirellula marina]EAQ79772.1 circumsporozoite protein-putative membrane associated protein-like [Blastopirellula marina DSM 3645]